MKKIFLSSDHAGYKLKELIKLHLNGSLVLFRGKHAIHRVTPTEGHLTRVLSVLAYNSEPDVKLSESARMTFFGKLH